MYYLIGETLREVSKEEIQNGPYVAILNSREWQTEKDDFEFGIDLEPDVERIFSTQAEVNYDALIGTFSIPDRSDISGEDYRFAFALDEKGIVFIDDSGLAKRYVDNIIRTKKWKLPGSERFLYDFLEQIIKDDLVLMEEYEHRLDQMEQAILRDVDSVNPNQVNDIRSDIRDLRNHYEQLLDLGQELEENENNFFQPENLRYFRLFSNRVERLRDVSASLRDYTMQIRDIYKAHLDIKQNRIITILTVVTTIFMPLTLIAGWYGMNFKYMPEFNSRLGYPVVIAVSIMIVVSGLIFFKKKKWL